MSIENHHTFESSENSGLPADIYTLLDTFTFDNSALDPDINGCVDAEETLRLFATTDAIAPYLKSLDLDPVYKHRVHAIMEQLRQIPAKLDDQLLADETKDFLRLQFENLSNESIDRLSSIDFGSYHRLRLFTSEIIHGDFSDEFTEQILGQLKLNFHFTDQAIDEIFDIYKMDQEKEESDEEEEEGELATEGDEQKAMAYVLARRMLPMKAKFYDQVMAAVDKFTQADYDLDMMDMSVLNALPLIDELGLQDKGMFDPILDDMDVAMDDRGDKWSQLVEQIRALDSRCGRWTQLLEDVDTLNKKRGVILDEIAQLESLGFTIYDEVWQNANKRLLALTPKGISYIEDPTAQVASEPDIDQAAWTAMDDLFKDIKGSIRAA